MNNNRRNSEGYLDPTANIAIHNADRESERFYKLLFMIFDICDLAGLKVEGRLTLVDNKTGRIWS